MQKEEWIKKIKEGILELQEIQKILINKNPTYPFLYPTIENAIYAMANLLTYIEEKNPYFTQFNEGYFMNRQIAMHKTFITDLHIGIEDGLRKIIKENKYSVSVTRAEQAEGIIEAIKKKIPDASKIGAELQSIRNLGGKHATFNDYLNVVLKNIISLTDTYRNSCRMYFDGISILRNKVSHSDIAFSESEVNKLKNAKLGNAVTSDGKGMVFTFEGYKFLVADIIRFFDNLYARL